ncbi:hypothetical protein, partial [Pyrobaculum aerophilum]|uniref:hypothetical protein n=1 Tax=Pyrobaculum aerophilum TaxID=13773 RepID=UPI002479E220
MKNPPLSLLSPPYASNASSARTASTAGQGFRMRGRGKNFSVDCGVGGGVATLSAPGEAPRRQ